jgi:hypothetical protein
LRTFQYLFPPTSSYEHLKSLHIEALSSFKHDALVLQCEEPVDKILPTSCQLCDDWATSLLDSKQDYKRSFLTDGKKVEPHSTVAHFRRHLGRHMEQLALFALPLNGEEGMEDESSDEGDDHGSDQSENENKQSIQSEGEILEPDRHVSPEADVDPGPQQVSETTTQGSLDIHLGPLEYDLSFPGVANADRTPRPLPPPPGFRPPGPPGPAPQGMPMPILQQINLTKISDILPREVLDEGFCKEKLTTYRAYTLRKAAVKDPKKDKPTWGRAEIIEERLAQDEIAKQIKKLNEGRRSLTDKKADLMPHQQGQINKLMDELLTEEFDHNFEWSLAQLDREERGLTKGRKETTTITVFFKRAPWKNRNPVILFQNIERNKQVAERARQEAAKSQAPPPVRRRQQRASFETLPKKPSETPGPLKLSGERDDEKGYDKRTASSSSESEITELVRKGKGKQRDKQYYNDSDAPSGYDSESTGNLGSESVSTATKAGKSDAGRLIPAFDPVAAAYQAGMIDAKTERFGLERKRHPPPLPTPVGNRKFHNGKN